MQEEIKIVNMDDFNARLDKEVGRISEILNCFQVDARNIENGMTYIDSREADFLARAIIHSIKENI